MKDVFVAVKDSDGKPLANTRAYSSIGMARNALKGREEGVEIVRYVPYNKDIVEEYKSALAFMDGAMEAVLSTLDDSENANQIRANWKEMKPQIEKKWRGTE